MRCTLTLDLGTTFFKAGIFDGRGRMTASAKRAPATRHPQPGWNELDVPVFRQTVKALVGELQREAPGDFARVDRVCYAMQTNSFVLLDEADRALTPIILWTDRRAEPLSAKIAALGREAGFYEATGVPRLDGGFMAAKLQWLADEDANLFGRARRLCLIGDYLTLWLTGEHVTEAGAAGLTAMIDIHRFAWREGPLETLRLERVKLARIERAGTVLGKLRREAARELGLGEDCLFVLGCLDQYAGAIGAGNTLPGGVSETTGTVLATVSLAEGFDAALGQAGVYQGPAFAAGWYYRMVFGGISANLLEAYRRRWAPGLSYDELTAAAQVEAGVGVVTLDREASEARGEPVFIGEADGAGHGPYVRAILEAIAAALSEQVGQVCEGRLPGEVRCVGGAARSDLLLKLKARALGTTTVALECAEPTSLGAAILAAGRGGVAGGAGRAVRARFSADA